MFNEAGFRNAIQEIYNEFVTDIADYVFNQIGMHYQSIKNIKQEWQLIIPYSREMEDLIMRRARLFIRLNISSHAAQSELFMNEFMPMVSKYIAKYTSRGLPSMTDAAKNVQKRLNVYSINIAQNIISQEPEKHR